MAVGFTQDQEQFREVVGRFFAAKSPVTEVRKLMQEDRGYSRDLWAQMAQELGVLGIHYPEEYGGYGFGAVELGIVAQEMGRYLYCGPYFASVIMAGYALINEGSQAQKERWLPGMAAGSILAALVLDDLDDVAQVGQKISWNAQRGLNGTADIVLDAHNADLLIVGAGTESGVGLFLLPADDSRVVITRKTSLDETRKLSQVCFVDAPATPLGDGQCDLVRLWDQLSTALAHEMIGGAEHLFNRTLEYLKMRVQFGRAIGSFQALKHRCADLLMSLELARAATHAAARYVAWGDGDAYAANMAKAMAGDAYMAIAEQAIQLRGGIGFTWEDDTHLWFKRAKSSEVFLGSPNWHREALIQKIEADQELQHA